MRLLVGLGNPGPDYARHRHNVGFMTLDEIVRRHGIDPGRARFHGIVHEGSIGGEKLIALKPTTYMNDSGRSVQAACQFYRLTPEQVFVIYDEIDLRPGKVRVKQGGGAGGHNGIRSIDAHIGNEFWRVRLGVGHPGHPDLVQRYVLHDFAKEEQPLVATMVEAVAAAIPLLLAGDANGFMSKVDVAVNPPKPKPPRRAPEEGKEATGEGSRGV